MISYLCLLVQFSPATGRAGHCRQISLCVDSTHRVPATVGLPHTGVSVLSASTLLRLPAALYGVGPALSAVPVFGYSTKVRIRLYLRFVPSPAWAVQEARGLGTLSLGAAHLFPPLRVAQAARGLGALSQDAARLFPPRPQRTPPVGFSGAVCPFPLPTASYLQLRWASSSLEFLSPFVLRTTGSVLGRVNFLPCSPTV